jgi:capsular polysaccharide transport system ATP-binding protein
MRAQLSLLANKGSSEAYAPKVCHMIALQNVTHNLRGGGVTKPLLTNVSLLIRDKDRIGIFAEASSGKSTLAKLLAGVEDSQFGSVTHFGRVSWPVGVAGIIHPELTIRQNIKLVADLSGVDSTAAEIFCLAFCQFTTIGNMRAKSLSPIQRACFAFGLSMTVPAQHYVFDDKFAVGNSEFQKRCQTLIEERLITAGMVLISRNIRILEAHCDRFFRLENGHLLECDDLSKNEDA